MLLYLILGGLASVGAILLYIGRPRRSKRRRGDRVYLRCDGYGRHLNRLTPEEARAFVSEDELWFLSRGNILAGTPELPREFCRVCNPQTA